MLNPSEVQSHAASVLDRMANNPYNPDPSNMSQGSPAYNAPTISSSIPQNETPPAGPTDPNPTTGPGLSSSPFGPGTTDPHNPFYVGPPEVSPTDILRLNAQGVKGLQEGQKKVGETQLDAATAKNTADVDLATKDKQAREGYDNELFGSSERERLAQHMYQADTETLLKEKQAAIKEQTDYANSMPTDLWGASGVNKIAGIIGLALGALGGRATGGKNTALDAMNTLADQNMRRMKMHYDMLGDKVKGYDNTYAMLRQKLGDSHSAELATREVMNQSFINQLQIAADSTVDSRAKAAIQQTIAGVARQSQTLQTELIKLNATQVDHAAGVAATLHGIDAAHAEHRESMASASGRMTEMPGEINGFIAPDNPNLRLSKAATDDVRQQQRGVAELKDAVSDIKTLVSSNSLSDQVLRRQAEARLKLAVVDAHELSKRVGGSEGELIEQDIGKLATGIRGSVTGYIDKKLVMKLLSDLDRSTTNGFAKGLIANGYTVDPKGAYVEQVEQNDSPRVSGNAIAGIKARGETSPPPTTETQIPPYTGAG